MGIQFFKKQNCKLFDRLNICQIKHCYIKHFSPTYVLPRAWWLLMSAWSFLCLAPSTRFHLSHDSLWQKTKQKQNTKNIRNTNKRDYSFQIIHHFYFVEDLWSKQTFKPLFYINFSTLCKSVKTMKCTIKTADTPNVQVSQDGVSPQVQVVWNGL